MFSDKGKQHSHLGSGGCGTRRVVGAELVARPIFLFDGAKRSPERRKPALNPSAWIGKVRHLARIVCTRLLFVFCERIMSWRIVFSYELM